MYGGLCVGWEGDFFFCLFFFGWSRARDGGRRRVWRKILSPAACSAPPSSPPPPPLKPVRSPDWHRRGGLPTRRARGPQNRRAPPHTSHSRTRIPSHLALDRHPRVPLRVVHRHVGQRQLAVRPRRRRRGLDPLFGGRHRVGRGVAPLGGQVAQRGQQAGPVGRHRGLAHRGWGEEREATRARESQKRKNGAGCLKRPRKREKNSPPLSTAPTPLDFSTLSTSVVCFWFCKKSLGPRKKGEEIVPKEF